MSHPAVFPKLPIVAGVTGHRDLRAEDLPRLEAALRGALEYVRSQCPDSPLELLSALAEGADCLAARVALAEGAALRVILPLPAASYETDFTTPGALEAFRDLLGRAASVQVMPLAGPPGEADRPGPARNRQYAAAGVEIARRCHVLFALWDGTAPGSEAGTAQIVEYRRTARRAWLSAPPAVPERPPRGLICHIPTPRRSRPEVPAPFTPVWSGHGGVPGPDPFFRELRSHHAH